MASKHSFAAPPTKFAEIVREIKRYPASQILSACNEFSRWAEEQHEKPPSVEFRYISHGLPARARVHITGHSLARLARLAIQYSSERRQGTLTKDNFVRLISMHNNLEDPFQFEESKNVNTALSFLLRTAWDQFPYQESITRYIPRHWLMFNQGTPGDPIDLHREFTELVGIPLRRFIEIGFAYASGAQANRWITRHFAASGVMAQKLSSSECERFLERTAATPERFRELSVQFRETREGYERYEFNLLTQRPFIELNGQLIAPVPQLIFRRITNGVVFDLIDHFKQAQRNPFAEYFGLLFERYIGALLKWTFGPGNVFSERAYGKSEKRGPDWTVLDSSTALLFECRTSRLSLASKTVADIETVGKDLRRIFEETAQRFPGKIKDLQNGLAGIDLHEVEEIRPIIVTYDSIFVEPIFRQLAAQGVLEGIQVIDVSELETLSAWNRDVGMSNLLRYWETAYKREPSACDPFLSNWSADRADLGLTHMHPLLDKVQDEFLAALLDGIAVDWRGRDSTA
jgi:hypothetical protein